MAWTLYKGLGQFRTRQGNIGIHKKWRTGYQMSYQKFHRRDSIPCSLIGRDGSSDIAQHEKRAMMSA